MVYAIAVKAPQLGHDQRHIVAGVEDVVDVFVAGLRLGKTVVDMKIAGIFCVVVMAGRCLERKRVVVLLQKRDFATQQDSQVIAAVRAIVGLRVELCRLNCQLAGGNVGSGASAREACGKHFDVAGDVLSGDVVFEERDGFICCDAKAFMLAGLPCGHVAGPLSKVSRAANTQQDKRCFAAIGLVYRPVPCNKTNGVLACCSFEIVVDLDIRAADLLHQLLSVLVGNAILVGVDIGRIAKSGYGQSAGKGGT